MRGPRAARTRVAFDDGLIAKNGALSIRSRYERIVSTGAEYVTPRTPSTIGLWLTPMPSTNRSGNDSSMVSHAAFSVVASRAYSGTMPVARTRRWVAPRNNVAETSASRPTASGSQTAA